MEPFSTALAVSWVLIWLAAAAIAAPASALGPAATRRMLVSEPGPALVWTWLTMAAIVPLLSAIHGFNWATALLAVAAWPVAWWAIRCRGTCESTFRNTVRHVVYRVVSPRDESAPAFRFGERSLVILAMPMLGMVSLVTDGTDIRLPMPLDFDTLWHSRQLMAGTVAWDPLASLASVLAAVSSAGAVHVLLALRLALVTLTATAAALLVVEAGGRWWMAAATAPAVILIAPQAAAHSWAVALVVLLGATSLLHWIRDRHSRDASHAVAALLLGVGLVVPFADRPDVLFRVTTTPHYLEHRAAAAAALALARSQPDDDWIAVGPPELTLEIGGARHYADLARFVSRFEGRAHKPGFRFGLPAKRVFVFIEKDPIEPAGSAQNVRFVDAQPAVYRVGHERARLQRRAWRLCDEYRRTHGGTTIVYDDAQLRIYRIER